MPYSFAFPQRYPAEVQALLAFNRLEARPRSTEFNRALRAEVRDPAWLLARQWQLHEFRAEDRGTPAFIDLKLAESPLDRLALGDELPRDYSPLHQPLEAAVEAQRRPIGVGLCLQMGQYWRRQLRAALLALPAPANSTTLRNAIGVFSQVFALAPPAATDPVGYAQAATTPEASALLELAGTDAIDGYALYQALTTDSTTQATLAPGLADSDRLADLLPTVSLAAVVMRLVGSRSGAQDLQQLPTAKLEVELQRFILTFHRLYLLGHDSTSWVTQDLAYSFAVGAVGAVVLGASHYSGGGELPWYAVDVQPTPPATPPVTPPATTRRFLPTQVQFAGSPAARWWEFEDRRVDVGQVTGDPSDWGRMLLQEFMFLYQSDWFAVPLPIHEGRICQLTSVQVTDVFGRCYQVQPAGAGTLTEDDENNTLVDNDAGRWRLFAQTDAGHTGPAPAPQLYLPAAVRKPLVGRPIEQVSFRREEATNLVWAVESVVSDGFAGGLDGSTAAAQVAQTLLKLVPKTPPAPAGSAAPAFTYQLASSVLENWIPFVPTSESGARSLEQGVLPRQGLTLTGTAAEVQPRTSLLQLRPGQPYLLHEHEVPPTGVRVDGLSYRARWYGGRTVLWFGRQRGPTQPSGSSGLTFDQLLPGSR